MTLTNPQAGDILDFGIMPSGLTAVITGNSIAISGEGSQVDYQNAIRAVTFENISENPSAEIRIIHVTVNDGELNSEIAIARIEVQGVNDVAELDLDGNDSSASGNGYETTFIEDGVAVSITDNDVVIVDVDDENIESATIVLTNPQALDVLSVGGLSIGITATVIGNTVTLTGTASLSAYEQALQAVRFSNTSDDPTTVDRLLNITLNDGDGNSGTAITIIHVTPVNDPPDAINDAVSTLEDTPVSITVLGNDSDPEGDPLSVTSHTQPANGTLVQNANGSFLYTPNVGFFGMDIFTYTISDGNGGTDTATVTVTVDAVADAPMAVDDNVGTDEDTPVTVDVLSNDSDPDGDVLTISGVTQGTNGSVTIDMMSGNPVYMPNLNFSGTDTFTYTISDGNGGTDTATVTVTVGAVGDAPVAVDDNVGTNEDTPVTVDVLSNDSDPDGDVFSISGVTQGMNGTVNIDLVSGNPIYTPNPNFSGVDNFTYTIDDGNGGTDTATVFVTVGAVADTPGFTVTPSSFSSSVDFESVDLGTRSWGSADVSSVGDGNWRTDNPGGRIEVGQETVYLRNNVRDNQVIELEYNRNNDSNLYTDVAAREGDVYALNFDYSARSGATNHSAIDLFWEGQLIATIDTHSVGLQSFNFNLLASATGNSRLELRAVDRNSVGGVLDNISVDLQQNTGYENNILNLPDMFGSLIDTDGSESLTYAINGIPDGAILTDGIHTFTSAAGATQAEVTAWDLSNLQLTPPPDYNGGLTLGYLVTATEASNGNQATRIEDVQLTILPANGDPVMDPNEQLVFNPASALIDGGDGIDTLLVSDNDDLDFSGISNIRNIERIDLTAGDHDISNLSVADVLTMTDGDNLLEILGDVSDNVELTNDWHATGNTLTQNGHQFAEFNNADDSVTLLIEDQVNVTIV
ncbi:MAG: tandem-95 repeat protein [Candidatus Thiodiazotropha sp. (ex. Lucinoma kazani)]